jgi:hypothetical protein
VSFLALLEIDLWLVTRNPDGASVRRTLISADDLRDGYDAI